MSSEVIAALLGALVVGFISLAQELFRSLSESGRERRKEALSALLEVHDGLTELSAMFGRIATHSLGTAAAGKLSTIELESSQKLERLEYHLTIHAPEMLKKYDSIRATSAKIMENWMKASISAATGTVDGASTGRVLSLWINHKDRIRNFQRELALFARRKYAPGQLERTLLEGRGTVI